MAKQNRYNYRGATRGSRMSYDAEIDRLRTTPTAKQRKFHRFLLAALREHEINPEKSAFPLVTRADFSREIERLVAICKENGIETASNDKAFVRVVTISDNGFRGQRNVKERLVAEEDLN